MVTWLQNFLWEEAVGILLDSVQHENLDVGSVLGRRKAVISDTDTHAV